MRGPADATSLPTEVAHRSIALDARFAGRSLSEWPPLVITEHVFVFSLVHLSYCSASSGTFPLHIRQLLWGIRLFACHLEALVHYLRQITDQPSFFQRLPSEMASLRELFGKRIKASQLVTYYD
jgi:hypothetical protein